MLLIALRPGVAMHLCGGNLDSMALFSTSSLNSCCDAHMPAFAPISLETSIPDASNVYLDNESCCEINLLKLNTDDYQDSHSLSQLLPLKTNIQLFDIIPIVSENADLHKVDVATTNVNYPPQGLFFMDVDIRNYVCIYRI